MPDLIFWRRHVDFANASDELGLLAEACKPASLGLNDGDVLEEAHHEAGKMDIFSALVVTEQTDLVRE